MQWGSRGDRAPRSPRLPGRGAQARQSDQWSASALDGRVDPSLWLTTTVEWSVDGLRAATWSRSTSIVAPLTPLGGALSFSDEAQCIVKGQDGGSAWSTQTSDKAGTPCTGRHCPMRMPLSSSLATPRTCSSPFRLPPPRPPPLPHVGICRWVLSRGKTYGSSTKFTLYCTFVLACTPTRVDFASGKPAVLPTSPVPSLPASTVYELRVPPLLMPLVTPSTPRWRRQRRSILTPRAPHSSARLPPGWEPHGLAGSQALRCCGQKGV